MMQTHPSILGFMVGSDQHPGDKATKIYVDAIRRTNWQTPIISSGSGRGYPQLLGPSGMKMNGPYEWVPPNYWWDVSPHSRRRGAAFGFGSELGAGVGTPEIESLVEFLSPADIEQLWASPHASPYHNGPGTTSDSRQIYNDALWHRYSAPKGLEDHIMKAQMMDYEATRAQFEAYSAKWSAKRPATGMIYWMLNSAWPSLHWNLFDFYLRAAGSYFGAKTRSRLEHVAYDYKRKDIYLINHSLDRQGLRRIETDIIDMRGKLITQLAVNTTTEPNTSKSTGLSVRKVGKHAEHGLVFMRLRLADEQNTTLSRNVYWLTKDIDKLSWSRSTWYHTPVRKYVNFGDLSRLNPAKVAITATRRSEGDQAAPILVTLENESSTPAVFIRLHLVASRDNLATGRQQIAPVRWEDNYVTLWPHERMEIVAWPPTSGEIARYVQASGVNVNIGQAIEITLAADRGIGGGLSGPGVVSGATRYQSLLTTLLSKLRQ